MEKIYTVAELAINLQLSEKTILRKLNSGEMPGSKIGHQWRVSQKQLDEYFESNSNQTEQTEHASIEG